MSIETVAAKNAPVVGPLAAAALAIDSDIIITVGAVITGLFFGALWRTASFLNDGADGKTIRSDLLISVLIGGANAILTLALVEWFNLGPMLTLALGVMVGATGLRAVPEIRDALVGAAKRKLLEQNVALISPDDSDMNDKMDQLRKSDTNTP